MANPYNMEIAELEQFIAKYPKASACNRADVEMFERLLATKKEQQISQLMSLETANGNN